VARSDTAQPVAEPELKVEGLSQPGGDNSNADSQTQAVSLVTSRGSNDFPIESLDVRLQEPLRNFETISNKMDRSTAVTDMAKLADAGVPKPQVAEALGYLFRDENSVEVKTDILNELGSLDDPSAFDQIVQGLDPRQPDEIHATAIEALDTLGDKRAIPLIQPFLTDRDEDVRNAAESAIDSLNDQ